jgi:NDP-sugar pyrophosphorylase family protein
LQPLTNQIPKPLVPICGVPLCEFALARIAAAGVERIVINTHRLPGEFIRMFPGIPGTVPLCGRPGFLPPRGSAA